jgi:hypothetical protein
VGKALCKGVFERKGTLADESRGRLQAFTVKSMAGRWRAGGEVAALDGVRGRVGRYNSVVVERANLSKLDERELSGWIDAYLLGEITVSIGVWLFTKIAINRAELQERIARFRESRLAPFLERAGLTGDLSAVPDEQFRERVLRFRCYLAEPDNPSDELLARLRVVASLSNLLSSVLSQPMSLLELKRALRPLQKSLPSVAPELHPLCYAIAEQLAQIGEHSPEDPNQLHQETKNLCYEWLHRLHAYWYAVLG